MVISSKNDNNTTFNINGERTKTAKYVKEKVLQFFLTYCKCFISFELFEVPISFYSTLCNSTWLNPKLCC